MKKIVSLIFIIAYFTSCNNTPKFGQLELVSDLDVRPGNVTVSSDGRIFSTIHPLDNPKIQIVEITSKNTYEPFPSLEMQKNGQVASEEKLDAPFGILVDKNNLLWTIDAGFELKKVRLFAFNVNTKELVHKIEIPQNVLVEGSFVQDLAIDENRMYAYLADIRGGIIFVDINNNKFRRYENQVMKPEDKDIIIDGEVVALGGNPARVGIDPIMLSADNEILYFGPMNGEKLYSVKTSVFYTNKEDDFISNSIGVVGKKPMTDGCCTDEEGNIFYTNLANKSIDILTKDGEYKTLVKDDNLIWPDNVRFGKDSWLYISVNQLHKSKSFMGEEKGNPPYKIMRVWTATKGITGK